MLLAHLSEQRLLVSATAGLAALVYTVFAVRACGALAAGARWAVAAGSVALIALLLDGVVAPEIGYALLCLLIVTVYLVDVVQEERERRRRVASLAPRPRVDIAPAIWMVVALLCAALVTPYALESAHRVAAVIVGLGAVAMAAIAWRIATAPQQLAGEDPDAERVKERAYRAIRVGNSSALAVAIVFVFATFVNQTSIAVTGLERGIVAVTFYAFLMVWIWGMVYAWALRRSLRLKST